MSTITPADKGEQRQEAADAARRRAFLAATHKGNLVAAVAVVIPVVRQTLLNGGIDADDILGEVDRLVGVQRAGFTDGNWQQYCDALSAGYALGVAMGRQIAPGFFEKGGAR